MTKGMALIAICCLLLAAPMCAEGAEVTFREGGGSGYIDLTWDVVSIITTSEYQPYPYNDSDWTSMAIPVSDDPTEDKYYVLLAIKDLVSTLPIDDDDITSATLTLFGYDGDSNYDSVVAYRVTTDWLDWMGWGAGLHESDVTGYWRYQGTRGWGGEWADPEYPFSSDDYDDTEAATGTWQFMVTASPADGPRVVAEGDIVDGEMIPDE